MSTIASIILIIGSFAVFFGYIDPTYNGVHQAKTEVKDLSIKELMLLRADYDRALTNSNALQEERDKFLDKFNQINKNDKAKLAKALPDNIDNVRLIIDLDEMAKKYGMRIRNFKADISDQKQTIGVDQSTNGTLTLTFSTTAAYNTFLAFMRDLEHSLRIIDISSIQFSSSDTSQLYDYTVTVKTYWLK